MKRLTTLIVLMLFVLGGAFAWWRNGTLPANPKDHTAQIFVIDPGEGMRKVSNDLKSKGLIKDATVFFLLTKKLGLDTKVQAGDFRLNPSMDAYEIAENLTHGTLDIWVTIPEGIRAQEIADILEANIPTYQKSWRNALQTNEGYLFPDTYLIPREATIDQIVSLMRNNFNKKYESLKGNPNNKLTQNEVVILASIIEREAIFDADRPMVAGILLNRINEGMTLGADPVIQYALGYQSGEKSWWKKNLTADDLMINSPYNNRTHYGLPPTPISNPGVSALEAALNPSRTDYLYYLSDSKGHLHYATTLQQHNVNVEKYIQ